MGCAKCPGRPLLPRILRGAALEDQCALGYPSFPGYPLPCLTPPQGCPFLPLLALPLPRTPLPPYLTLMTGDAVPCFTPSKKEALIRSHCLNVSSHISSFLASQPLTHHHGITSSFYLCKPTILRVSSIFSSIRLSVHLPSKLMFHSLSRTAVCTSCLLLPVLLLPSAWWQ